MICSGFSGVLYMLCWIEFVLKASSWTASIKPSTIILQPYPGVLSTNIWSWSRLPGKLSMQAIPLLSRPLAVIIKGYLLQQALSPSISFAAERHFMVTWVGPLISTYLNTNQPLPLSFLGRDSLVTLLQVYREPFIGNIVLFFSMYAGKLFHCPNHDTCTVAHHIYNRYWCIR